MAFRLGTALGVLLPFFAARMLAGVGTPIWMTFLVAIVAFGLGRVADTLAKREKKGLAALILLGVWVVTPLLAMAGISHDEAGPTRGPTTPGTAARPEPAVPSAPTGRTRWAHNGLWRKVSMADRYGCGVKKDGTVWCWGDAGSLGTSKTSRSKEPVRVTGLSGATDVSAGMMSACALLDDQSVWCWGWNFTGAIGKPPTDTHDLRSEPVRVDVQHVTSVSVGSGHACATDREGHVWCWGSSRNGEAGVVGKDHIPPTVVLGISGAAMVSAGYEATCAVDGAGNVWCWGAVDLPGHVKSEDTTPTPRKMNGMPPVTMVSVGVDSACALGRDASVWCWGHQPIGSPAPKKMDIEPATHLSVGSMHACAVLRSGGVRCWGKNYQGQLGAFGNVGDSNRVEDLSNAEHVAANEHETCAVADEWLRCWGARTSGEAIPGSD